MSLEGGRDSLSIDTWRQRILKERRAPGVSAMWESGRIPSLQQDEGVPPVPPSRPAFGGSQVTIYSAIMATTPREGFGLSGSPLSPRKPSPRTLSTSGVSAEVSSRAAAVAKAPPAARPHMQHHFGYGWGDGPSEVQPFGSIPLRATESFREKAQLTSLDRLGEHNQKEEGLQMSPHPFLRPSQRLHGNDLDAGIADRLPPRASRKPKKEHPNVKPHAAHFLSYPGHCFFVPPTKHAFRPDVTSRKEARGELPLTAQMLVSPGTRPDFPTFGPTSSVR